MCIHDNTATNNPTTCYACFNEIFKNMTYEQIILLYKKFKEKREFDPDKVYKQTVKFYIDKKGYSKEQANEIAKKVVEQQMEKHKK
jgi:SOS response regulatory protein OraA/RecX